MTVNSKLKTADRKLLTNVNDLVNRFSCNIESSECMKNSCEFFLKCHVNEDKFEVDVKLTTDTDESDSSNSGDYPIWLRNQSN